VLPWRFLPHSGSADWFNANLGGRAPFVRSGGGGMRMPSAPDARARFNGFWDCIQLAYDRPHISALEFATPHCQLSGLSAPFPAPLG